MSPAPSHDCLSASASRATWSPRRWCSLRGPDKYVLLLDMSCYWAAGSVLEYVAMVAGCRVCLTG